MISQPSRRVRRLAATIALIGSLAACSTQPEVAATNVPAKPGIGQQAATVALGQVGGPYRYGGSSPSGFDCSGLVQFAYARAGKSIPRTTAAQFSTLTPVAIGQIRVGDLLFFDIAGKMSHVGLYVGGGRFVHAPSSGKAVTVDALTTDYYRDALIRAGRPL